MDDFPRAVQLDHHAAFVMGGHAHAAGQGGADQQGVTGNGRIAIALDMQVREVKAGRRGDISFLLCAEDRPLPGIGRHHEIMERNTVNAMGGDPPLVECQVFGGGFMLGFQVIFLNGLQMLLQKSKNFRVVHNHSIRQSTGTSFP